MQDTLTWKPVDTHEHYLLSPALSFPQWPIKLSQNVCSHLKKTSPWPRNINCPGRQVTTQDRYPFFFLIKLCFGLGMFYGNVPRRFFCVASCCVTVEDTTWAIMCFILKIRGFKWQHKLIGRNLGTKVLLQELEKQPESTKSKLCICISN